MTGQPIPDLEVTAVRGTEGFRTSVIKVGDLDLKVGVVTGLKNVVPVLEAVKNGTLDLHFIEVMTCPEGCVSGGGQPKLLMDTDREEPMRQEELRPLPMTENWPTGNLTKILRSKRFTKNSWKSPTAILRTIFFIQPTVINKHKIKRYFQTLFQFGNTFFVRLAVKS